MFDVMMVVCDKYGLTTVSIQKLIDYAPGNYRITVVDNGGEPRIAGWLNKRRLEGKIQVVRLNKRVGPAAGRNAGFAATKSDVVVALDDDVWVMGPAWYRGLLQTLIVDPKTALVGPCGSRVPGSLREDWTHHGYENMPFFGKETASGEPSMLLDIIPGMCIAFKRQCVVEVGGWDDGYDPFTAQDADLCMQLKTADYDVRLGLANVNHFGGGGQSHLLVEAVTGENVLDVATRSLARFYDRWDDHEHLMVCNRGHE